MARGVSGAGVSLSDPDLSGYVTLVSLNSRMADDQAAFSSWCGSSFAPLVHTHVIANVTGLQAALDSKAQLYSSIGLMNGGKIWIGQATANSSGAFSVDISTAGFTAPPNVQITPASIPSALLSNGGFASLQNKTITATNVSGNIRVTQNVLGVLTLGLSNINGTVLDIQAIGI